MTHSVLLTPRAEADIESVVHYFSTVHHPTIQRWVASIRKTILGLAVFPERNPSARMKDRAGRLVRVTVHGRRSGAWRIYYAVDGQSVFVYRVVRGARGRISRDDLD